MYENQTRRVADRIVNIHQPHVRPNILGKSKKAVEFGAEITVSMAKGYDFFTL